MGKKLGELFLELAEKAGIQSTDERLKEVAGVGIEVSDELVNDLQSNLMTLDAAIANDKVIEKAKTIYSQGLEQSLYETLAANGLLTKEQINELKKPGVATGAKMKQALAKIAEKQAQELQAARGDGATAQELEALKKNHKELNAEIERLNADLVNKQKQFEQEKVQTVIETKKDALISKIAWADHFDVSIRKPVFEAALQQKLSEIGGALVVENNQLFLRKSSDTQSDLYNSQNQKVTVDSLINLLVQEKGFAKAGNGKPNPPNPGANPTLPPGGNKPTNAQAINKRAIDSIYSSK